MPPHTSMSEVIAHISNPGCSNTECPVATNSSCKRYQQNLKNSVSHSNSVWKAELRVRYIPSNLRELYEKDRTTCHFYFDQVQQNNNFKFQHFENLPNLQNFLLGQTRLPSIMLSASQSGHSHSIGMFRYPTLLQRYKPII